MNTPRWLTRDALDGLLSRFADEGGLVAPVRVDGELLFRTVSNPGEICRDYVNTLAPPRDLFLPTPERLLVYRVEGGHPVLETPDGDGGRRPRVVFGIRSCDVAGLAYLERFLSGEPFRRPGTADDPFLARRDAATLISVVCREAGPTCMCVCCEGGPALERGYDWQLTELDAGWLVELGSPRGERLAARCAGDLGDVPPGALAERDRRLQETKDRFLAFSERRVPTMAASRMVSAGLLPEAFWRVVGERCVECGGCAFVCPTCSCFNVADVTAAGSADFPERTPGVSPAVPGGPTESVADGRWERVRLRDNCILPGFVRQAGGGYPRWTCGERCLTRFFHKLSQQFHARMGALGCTGCGRCVQVCLGEEGIDRVAEAMREVMIGERRRGSRSPRTSPALGVKVPLGGR
jgi:ferredoxin